MTEVVEQRVSGWQGWPDDVRDRLREWNASFLLSFRRGPDFLCEGCGRQVKAHPNGNAIVRSSPKEHGAVRCEECLIELARSNELPPAVPRPSKIADRLRRRIVALENKIARLRVQLELDQVYMDALEAEVSPVRLAAVRDELRGRYRKPKP